MNKNELENFSIRTDLAYEQTSRMEKSDLPDVTTSESTHHEIKVSKTVVGPTAAEIMKKRSGNYYTIDLSELDFHDNETCRKIELALSDVLETLMTELGVKDKRCLVIGLGNVNVTPDSLGPYVLDNIVVTRHLFQLGSVNNGYSEVSGMSPGVMGNTGIETFDIINGVLSTTDVDFLIVVDALAAASIKRVNRTIQVTDAGISPGSGVGNKRKELSYDTIGIPVIAIGVPTVVDAVTITSDTIDYLLKYLNNETFGEKRPASLLATKPLKLNYNEIAEPDESTKEHFLGKVGLLPDQDKRILIKEVLSPTGYNMMVTPKEIDEDIEDLAKIIATGIDLSLHQSYKNTYLQ